MNHVKDELYDLIRKFNTRDPYSIVSKMNVELIYNKFHPKIKGLTVYDSKKKIHQVGLNINLSYIMERFVLAHELGHIVLHPKTGRYFIEKNTLFIPDKLEAKANQFAASLLIDKEKLIKLVAKNEDIDRIAFELEVPRELVKIRLKENDIFFY